MDKAIRDFPKQFEFEPGIVNGEKLKKYRQYIVCGMGGSAKPAELLKDYLPELDLTVSSDYGLPPLAQGNLKSSLIILSSYSGNTEEVLEAWQQAKKIKLDLLVISVGGELLKLARDNSLPYIKLPDTGIQPRSALGFSFLALLKACGQNNLLKDAKVLRKVLVAEDYEEQGKSLAKKIKGKVPVIYASTNYQAVAFTWKIKFNETGKIPAFYNVLPELNHNEMTGFDVKDSSRTLSQKFLFIFLVDKDGSPRHQQRFAVLKKLYEDRGLPVEVINITGPTKLAKMFSSLILADWAAFYTAKIYGLEAEQVPMVEEFKKLIR